MRRRLRIPLALACLLFVALSIWFNRTRLERLFVAYRIFHAQIFTPPGHTPGESRLHNELQFYWDFAGVRMAREARVKELSPQLRPLIAEIDRRQAAGEGMQYSMHIYREVRWRLNFTSDVAATRARIEDLRQSLAQTEMQKEAAEQRPSDGSWGTGLHVYYLQLYYSVEDGLSSQTDPKYPLLFLDRINSPAKLKTQLDSARFNDFTRTGEFKREELDETFSALARLLFGNKRSGYAFDPNLQQSLKDYVDEWQNPLTGCWGVWLVDRHGDVWKMDDTGMTFHVVSDLKGRVNHLDRIAKRLLELQDLDFPAGTRISGKNENHLNMDLVKVLRVAWPSLDEPTKSRARDSIARMLSWCLKESLQPDGSFKTSELDDTVGDAFSYGVSFLDEAGYFHREDRFWTDQAFPEAEGIRKRISARIESIGLNDPNLKSAYEELQAGPRTHNP